jgi:hypothetical protein
MNNYKYRFKTEKEFIDEYGENWKNIVMWSDNMYYLLGQDFEVNVNDLDDRKIFAIFYRDQYYYSNYNMGKNPPHGWGIFTNMLKRKVNYDPKKLIFD